MPRAEHHWQTSPETALSVDRQVNRSLLYVRAMSSMMRSAGFSMLPSLARVCMLMIMMLCAPLCPVGLLSVSGICAVVSFSVCGVGFVLAAVCRASITSVSHVAPRRIW